MEGRDEVLPLDSNGEGAPQSFRLGKFLMSISHVNITRSGRPTVGGPGMEGGEGGIRCWTDVTDGLLGGVGAARVRDEAGQVCSAGRGRCCRRHAVSLLLCPNIANGKKFFGVAPRG